MLLEIPIKLESYVNEIKRQTKFIKNTNKITLLQMGSTNIDDKTKYLFLMYNPFPINITVNCDFFTKDSNVCKMYPGEFILHPESAYAFVIYVTGDNKVEIDEDKVVANLKNNISRRISKLNGEINLRGYEPHNIYKVAANVVSVEDTINLEEHINRMDDPLFSTYKQSHSALVDVALLGIEKDGYVVKVGMKFTNTSDLLNLQLEGCRLKIFDDTKIMHVEVKQEINLKLQSSKIVYIQLNRVEFEQINQEKMQFKIVLL